MKPHSLTCSVVCALVFGPVAAQAQTAGVFEPFTFETNAESWLVYDYSDDQNYIPGLDSAGNGQNPDIYFTFAGSASLDFYADSFSSGGAFVGDLAAGGVDAIGCDFFVEDIDSFDFGEFFLYSATLDRYYVSDFIIPTASGWDFAYASLSADLWYVFENGSYVPIELTPEILANITEAGFTFHPKDVAGSDGKIVALDNFTYYGALVLPELATSVTAGMFELEFDRRPGVGYSVLSSPDLSTWTPVPGAEWITGTTAYTLSQPVTPSPRFFKVGIEDSLTAVPEMDPP